MVASVNYNIKYTTSLWPPKCNHCIPNINLVLTLEAGYIPGICKFIVYSWGPIFPLEQLDG